MNNLASPTGPNLLAAWCATLAVDDFRRVYEHVMPAAGFRNWSVVVAEADLTLGATAGLFLLACQEAAAAGLLLELASRLSKIRHGYGQCSEADASRMIELLAGMGYGGRMQALVRPGALLRRGTLLGVLDVDRATAVVRLGVQVIGTAFLVRPDLVLTAAHVVLDHDTETFIPTLRQALSFSFLIQGDAVSAKPIVAFPAPSRALVAHSLPWGRPPDQLFVPPAPESDLHLDFALVRLDREVHHVKVLDISGPARPAANDPLVILGYPGGTDMAWQVGAIGTVGTERVEHDANAMPGMSGSCCIDGNGSPVALHEGSIAAKRYAFGGQTPHGGINRGVCLSVIRNAMRSGAADPLLTARSSPRHAFMDDMLVRRWGNGGLRLAPAELQATWRELVNAATGWTPEQPGQPPAFHPWFKREDFETWVDQNLSGPASNNRLCIVNGEPGSGKSFLGAILQARAGGGDGDDVVLISATQTTAWSWREALAKWGVAPMRNDGLRPAEGVMRHDEVPEAARRIARQAGRDGAKQERPLFVFIDFDGYTSFPMEDERPWLPFMQELLGHAWIRLVVVGAPESVTAALVDTLEDGNENIRNIRLGHLDTGDFRAFSRLLLRKGDGALPPGDEAVKAAQALHQRILGALPAMSLRTVAAVMAGILLQRSLEPSHG